MKVLKTLLATTVLLGLTACTPSYKSGEGAVLLPPELSHCSSYILYTDSGARLYVVNCPNQDVTSTTKAGKHDKHTVVIN